MLSAAISDDKSRRVASGRYGRSMLQRDADMLTGAIERNAAAVLSLPSAGMVRYYKSRFLRAVDERIWLESVPTERKLIESLIEQKTPVEVTFKTGQRKVVFQSEIFELDQQYRFFNAEEAVQAVVMHRPAVVKPQQRRNYFRVRVRPEDGFKIQLWRINEQVEITDPPNELCELFATVRDLSVGGVGVTFMTRPLLAAGQRMRIILQQGQAPPMLFEGRSGEVRHQQSGELYETGFTFHDLQGSLQGRQMLTLLTRIVSSLQLLEAKRQRGEAAA